VTPADIDAQVGRSSGLWTHTPVDWAGNENPAVPKPANWPLNAAQSYMAPGAGPRPGQGNTQTGPLGGIAILNLQLTNVTTTGFGVAVTFDAAPTSCRVNYGTTQAVSSNAAGTTAITQTISVTGLTTKTTYYFNVQATNAQGTTVSGLLTVTTF
jgi:hypothetical protein